MKIIRMKFRTYKRTLIPQDRKRTLTGFTAGMALFLILQCPGALGQQSPAVNSKNKNTVKPKSIMDSATIEDKLVSLALEGPQMRISVHQGKINEYQLKAAKNTWTNLLAFTVNYNDQTFAKSSNPNYAYVYPKYYLGITVPMGTFLSRTGVKSAREAVGISKENQEELSRTIRQNVLTRYRKYKAYESLLSIQNEVLDDLHAVYLQAEKKFADGTVSIDLYTTAAKNYNEARAARVNLQLQQDLAQLELEELIGVKLETVIK